MENYEKKIEELAPELTLDEKIGMIHGDGLFRTKAAAAACETLKKSQDFLREEAYAGKSVDDICCQTEMTI